MKITYCMDLRIAVRNGYYDYKHYTASAPNIFEV